MSVGDPKRRHEFVGMMFAVAIGEVGLQVAAIVRAGSFITLVPAYSHVFLATFVIAMSWVGWSVSPAPGARQDVTGVFQWEFIVLLLDVALVITYFILVRTVEFTNDKAPHIGSPAEVASWIFVIFVLYFIWDVITKVVIPHRDENKAARRAHLKRIVPTIICLLISGVIWFGAALADSPHRVVADFSLFSLFLLFRAWKDYLSGKKRCALIAMTAACLTIGTFATMSSWRVPLPDSFVKSQTSDSRK